MRHAALHSLLLVARPLSAPHGETTALTNRVCDGISAALGSSWRRLQSTQKTESTEHRAARIAHTHELRALRAKWRAEFAEQRAQRLEKAHQRQSRLQQAKSERQEQRAKHKRELAAAAAQDARDHRAAQRARLEEASRWRTALDHIYGGMHEARRVELLEESKHWIRPEDVDRRVQEALDKPVDLYKQWS